MTPRRFVVFTTTIHLIGWVIAPTITAWAVTLTIYYQDESVSLHHGDSLEVAHELPSGSVDCIVTSPPYFGLRDYGIEGQYGLEASPTAYVETMRSLFAELRRVLADDGTLWLNIGDSYATGHATGKQGATGQRAARTFTAEALPAKGDRSQKNLLGIPWRTALALQDDGWILRNAIVWNKPNAMPESVTDRLSTRYEMVFMFSKSRRYWFDLNPVRTPHAEVSLARAGRARVTAYAPPGQTAGRATETVPNALGANPGDVWSIPTQPFAAAHFAVMPPALAERCIQAGCRPAGTVLDPFSGSGTTGLAAAKHGRKYVGIDLNAEYLDLSLQTRLRQPGLDFDAEVG